MCVVKGTMKEASNKKNMCNSFGGPDQWIFQVPVKGGR